jgi:uncharacterized protein
MVVFDTMKRHSIWAGREFKPAKLEKLQMKMRMALLVTALFAAGPALAQSATEGTAQKAPAQHQPGTPAQPKTDAPAKTPTPAQTPAPAEKLDPAKEAAIRHLMEITEVSKLGGNIQEYITKEVHDVVGRAITPEKMPQFMDTFSKKFDASAPPSAITDAVVPIYAKNFSMEDIQGLIQFYESPLGKRVVKTLPEISQESQRVGLEMDQKAALVVLRGMSNDYTEIKQMLPAEEGKSGDNAPAPAAAPAPAHASTPSPAPAPANGAAPAPKPAPQK